MNNLLNDTYKQECRRIMAQLPKIKQFNKNMLIHSIFVLNMNTQVVALSLDSLVCTH